MWTNPGILIPMCCTLLCIGVGIVHFRRIPGSFRLLVLQAFLAVISTLAGLWMTHQGYKTNHIVFYIFMVLDFLIMLFAVRNVFGRHFRLFAAISIPVVFLLWGLFFYMSGFDHAYFQSFVVYSIVLTIAYFVVLLRRIHRPSGTKATGIYLIAVFVMLYYACTIPSFGFMDYVMQRDMELASRIYYINDVMSFLRYLFTAAGLMLLARASASPAHAYE